MKYLLLIHQGDTPTPRDPEAWAREAYAAGMRYAVITTKHHDGFCLWDTDLTDYKVTNTPWGEDLIAPMVEAFRSEDMKVGFYHSLIDWHHPEFPVDGLHSRRDDTEYIEANKDRDIARYREYLHGQTRELLTRFGRVDEVSGDRGVEPGQALAGLRLPVWPGHAGLLGRGLGAQGRFGGPAGGAGAVAVDGQVAGDGEDPGALAVGGERRELREAAPCPQEGLLHQVAGQLGLGHAAQEVGVDGVAVLVEDPGEDRRVIAARGHPRPP
jgi:hypothetical protein